MEISLLKDLVDAIGAAGDAIAKIADGFKHLVVTGVGGIDAARARATYGRLLNQSASLAALNFDQHALAGKLRSYVHEAPGLDPAARQKLWRAAILDVAAVLSSLTERLGALRDERSEFVLEPAFDRLSRLCGNPGSLLQWLLDRDSPESPDELRLVSEVAVCYARMVTEVDRARGEMNAYIKTLKQ